MNALTYQPPSGPYPVGVRDGELVDSVYPTVRTEDSQGRRIMVRVWYPAGTREGERRPYLVGDETRFVEWCVEAGGAPPQWAASLETVTTFSVPDVPAVPATFPTLIFSHGATGWVSMNTSLMEHLTSHGYIVWAIAHPGEASGLRYADGSIVRHDGALQAAFVSLVTSASYQEKHTASIERRRELVPEVLDDLGVGAWARRWVDDMRAVIDAIETASIEGSAREIAGSSDLGVLGTAGLSFGGSAAVSTAQVDARVKAAANLDGEQFLSDLLGVEARVPLLHLSTDFAAQLAAMGNPDVTTIDANEFFFEASEHAGLSGHVHRLRVADVAHIELSDLVLLPQDVRAGFIPGGGKAESQRSIDLVNATVGSFFDHTLRGAERDFPTRQLADFPGLTEIDLAPIREWARGRTGTP